MQKVKMALVPCLILALLTLLAFWNLSVNAVARFSFLWDTILGIALGVGLCLLPGLSGVKPRPIPNVGLYWIAAFLMALLLCLQYMALITGTPIFGQTWLLLANGRSCVVEGAGLGFCMTHAMRGR